MQIVETAIFEAGMPRVALVFLLTHSALPEQFSDDTVDAQTHFVPSI
jgi:hypothetical protein